MVNILQLKNQLRKTIASKLTSKEIREAIRDHHARRKPRPCGMTIHTGIGCSLRCTYCYIEDMGFNWIVKPYPLTGLQLVYALLYNPYFVPGEYGTLIAIGSVTEPFLGVTREKTFEYIEAIATYLKNPIQFSTKMYLTRRDAYRLKQLDPGISPLITIVTIKYKDKLEPLAPPPEKRFETIKNLRSTGLKPILFLRPIIPGIIEEEYVEILEKARDSGAVGVVVGSLRVTNRILDRLRKAGLDIGEIIRRLPRKPRGREQVPISTRDLKEEIIRYARKIGLIAFPEACMANIYTHGRICWKMIYHNIVVPGLEPPQIRMDELKKMAEENNVVLRKIIREEYFLKMLLEGDHISKALFSEYVKCRFGYCVRILGSNR